MGCAHQCLLGYVEAMKEHPQRVLGIDPGLRAMGYGVIEAVGRDAHLITYGVITTNSKQPFPERLKILYDGLYKVIQDHQPECMSFEKLIYAQNITIALQLGQARGAAILAGANHNLPMVEYNPTEIKSAIVGRGRASKDHIQKMVKILLNLQEPPEPDHAADALAAALTYVHAKTVMQKLRQT